jgi:tetratricopeptide (TPR) repeat protein/transcriptional regulator with XRE-family HTH domain
MVTPDTGRPDTADWAYAVLPSGTGLRPLPSALWESWEIRQAAAHESPGTVIAIARRAHGLNQGRLGTMAGFSQSAISRLESGGNLAYDTRVLRIVQRLLGIPPHLLGLCDDTVPVLHDDAARLFAQIAPGEVVIRGRAADGRRVPVAVDRHSLRTACSTSIFGGLSADSFDAVHGNRSISPEVVRRLRVVRRLLNESDNWLGSADLLAPTREMYEVADRMRHAATGDLRRELLTVAALYAEFCGWLHQETGDVREAVAWTERALEQAQAAEDWNLVAYAYLRMSQFAEIDGDGDRVIGLARAAQRERDLSVQVRSLALMQEARGHAVARDRERCLKMFDETEAAMAGIDGTWSDEYRLGYWLNEQGATWRVATQRAECLLEMGDPRSAISIYESAREGLNRQCLWERGLHTAKLARAYAATGELDHAASLGHEALETVRNAGCVIVANELRKLTAWRDAPAIATLTGTLGPSDRT